MAELENGDAGDALPKAAPTEECVKESAAVATGATPVTAVGGIPLVQKPQTAKAQRVMSLSSIALAILVLCSSLRGALSVLLVSLPRDDVVCRRLSRGGLTYANDEYRLRSEASETGSCLLLFYTRPLLLAFQLIVTVVFAGVLVRVAVQL